MLLAKGLCSPTRSRNPPICSHEETRHVTDNEADPKSVLRATLSPIGGFGSLDGMHGGGGKGGGVMKGRLERGGTSQWVSQQRGRPAIAEQKGFVDQKGAGSSELCTADSQPCLSSSPTVSGYRSL